MLHFFNVISSDVSIYILRYILYKNLHSKEGKTFAIILFFPLLCLQDSRGLIYNEEFAYGIRNKSKTTL